MPAPTVGLQDPELAAAMKVLADQGKPGGIMRTWYCDECSKASGKHTIHVDKGRAGCATCAPYEARVGVSW